MEVFIQTLCYVS